MSNTASEKQVEFINSLKSQRDMTTVEAQTALNVARELWTKDAFTKEAASKVIYVLRAQPYAQRRSETPSEAPEGMHRVGEQIYKVQRSPESGRLYAKKLVKDSHLEAKTFAGVRVTGEFEEVVEWRFEYTPGAIRNLSESTRMSLEDAAEFGHLYGVCAVCGRTLTNEESIALGIGPVCRGQWS